MRIADFFQSEALSNWGVFFLGLLVGWATVLFRKYFPGTQVVQVEKVEESSLLDLHEDARGRLSVKYADRAVMSFHRTVFVIRNSSREVLENIVLKLHCADPGPGGVYDSVVEDPMEDLRESVLEVGPAEDESGGCCLRIFIPYLNPSRATKDRVRVGVYSSHPVVPERVVGGGKGWVAGLHDNVQFRDELLRAAEAAFEASGFFGVFPRLFANVLRVVLFRWPGLPWYTK